MIKIYLACPYTHNSPEIRQHRFNEVNNIAGALMKNGYVVISPISMSHPIAISNNLPLTFEFWQRQNHEFIRWCDSVFVLRLPGWEESKGVADEIEYATELKKEVRYI